MGVDYKIPTTIIVTLAIGLILGYSMFKITDQGDPIPHDTDFEIVEYKYLDPMKGHVAFLVKCWNEDKIYAVGDLDGNFGKLWIAETASAGNGTIFNVGGMICDPR